MKILLESKTQDQGGNSGEPPEAAKTVLNSKAQESDAAEIVKLRRERDDALAERKALAEENKKLKTPPTPQTPKPEANDWLF